MPKQNKHILNDDSMSELRDDLGDFMDDGDANFALGADDRLLGISMDTGYDKWDKYLNEGRAGSRFVSLIW